MSIQRITSRRVELPPIFLIENEDDYRALPKGLPYIIGSKDDLKFITIFLEFQTLYKSCLRTGLPLNWLKVLQRAGYKASSIRTFSLCSGGSYWESSTGSTHIDIDTFIEDQYLVNFDRLSDLKILPKWLDDLKASVEQNIIDEVTFDPTAFNKQLGLNIGAAKVKHNMKNLLILDVSGSIPRAVVKTTSALAKLMSKKFYADIIITSGQSVLIDYEDVQDTNIEEVVRESGGGNEGKMFASIIEKHKDYNTVIAFGDNDNPINFGADKAMKCNMKIENLYSLHTDKNSDDVVGYGRCFKPNNPAILIKDWIETIV